MHRLSFAVHLGTSLLALLMSTPVPAADTTGDIYLDLQHTTHVSVGWGTAHSDASVAGTPLRIGGAEFTQGIGTHAPSALVFPLEAPYRWLTFYAGISADMTEKGSATVQVWADNTKKFETEVLRIGEEPRYFCVPVAGVRELRLVCTDAGDGIAADHVNLGNLRLSGQEQAPKPDHKPPLVFVGRPTPPESPLILWYLRPAQRWLESLPIGNGRLGAMVFGDVSRERLALNESTFWSGAPDESHNNPTAREHLSQIRQLLFDGEYRKATDLISQHLLGRRGNYGTHLPVGDLIIQTHHASNEVREYRRHLDLDGAVATVSYGVDGVQFSREVLASHPDEVIVVRWTADRPGQISCQLRFRPNREPCRVGTESDDTLTIEASARETMHSDGETGVSLGGLIRAIPEGGQITARDGVLQVDRADAVTILIALNTDFRGGDPWALSRQQLAAAAEAGLDTLRERHVADHRTLFQRVNLDLGPSPDAQLPTDQRLARMRSGEPDPALLAQFFQYGRYLLIAGSRDSSPLPTNLQGIWNDNLACTMGWTCDFHLDINMQQNYWPAEVCNLSECHEPLFRLIESLREPGRRTAHTVYGARGWVAHVVTNAWGFTAPGWGLGWGVHPTGGVWIASHLWEHYLFTGDDQFLEQRAYPVLKEAATFFLDYMVRHPHHGYLVTGPATSPENAFVTPNGQGACSESMGPTCDSVLVRDLFASCIAASRTLGVDESFRAQLEAALENLPPLRVGKDGQLMEWLEDYDEAIPNHRHTTHLIALFPGCQITPDATRELAKAARVTIERRTSQPNWEDVEWSRGNLIAFFARLRDGDEALRHVLGLLCENSDDNLLTFSRGGIAGAPQNIFCVDGNSAGTAGIAEMLLQSHAGEIELLPALPSSWPTGSVRGLRARGAVEVDLAWQDGRLTHAVLRAQNAETVRVRYGQFAEDIPLAPGEEIRWEPR